MFKTLVQSLIICRLNLSNALLYIRARAHTHTHTQTEHITPILLYLSDLIQNYMPVKPLQCTQINLPFSEINSQIILNFTRVKTYFLRFLKPSYLHDPIYNIHNSVYLSMKCVYVM